MSAVAMKDNLLQLLSVDDTDTLLTNVGRVIGALELTWGLWMELGYAYKGNEILNRCIAVCNHTAQRGGPGCHRRLPITSRGSHEQEEAISHRPAINSSNVTAEIKAPTYSRQGR